MKQNNQFKFIFLANQLRFNVCV